MRDSTFSFDTELTKNMDKNTKRTLNMGNKVCVSKMFKLCCDVLGAIRCIPKQEVCIFIVQL